MKKTISNIAWNISDEKIIFEKLKILDIDTLEIAITKYFNDWDIKNNDIISLKNYFEKNHFKINSIQSIMYTTDINLFDQNNHFIKHIEKVLYFSNILGANNIIFGSPKNRRINQFSEYKFDLFIETLKKIDNVCENYNINFCIEPNPKLYSCDFITKSSELFDILENDNFKKIKMHLDTACMFLEEDDFSNIEKYEKYLQHFHISEPNLNNLSEPKINHIEASSFLKKINYKNYVSIEMLNCNKVDYIFKSINYVKNIY